MARTTARSTTEPPAGAALGRLHPLSDRGRWVKVVLAGALLITCGVYLAWVTDSETIYVDEMLADPEGHHGAPVYLGQFRVTALHGDLAVLWSPWTEIPAGPVPGGVQVGDVVSLVGTFQRDATVAAGTWKVHELLWVKKLSGVVATLGVAGLGLWAGLRHHRRGRRA